MIDCVGFVMIITLRKFVVITRFDVVFFYLEDNGGCAWRGLASGNHCFAELGGLKAFVNVGLFVQAPSKS